MLTANSKAPAAIPRGAAPCGDAGAFLADYIAPSELLPIDADVREFRRASGRVFAAIAAALLVAIAAVLTVLS